MNIDLGWTKANLKSIAWHAGVLAIAAIITYLLEVLKTADFGMATPFVVLALSTTLKALLEFLRKA